jgi:hypothetical protein
MTNQSLNEKKNLSLEISISFGWTIRLIILISSLVFAGIGGYYLIKDNPEWFRFCALGMIQFSFWGIMKHLSDH